ncbi:MAG: hypothetical protein JWO92_1363 [Chitinophagaceae bacterium]|nr:hypothetical protein [Chitinophagaceae bacterium]
MISCRSRISQRGLGVIMMDAESLAEDSATTIKITNARNKNLNKR